MSNQFPFTKARIEALEPAETRRRYRDTKVDGLVVEVMPSNTKTFRVYKKIKGQKSPVSVSLGRYPAMSIENARKQALSKLEALSGGLNPNELRRAEALADVTLAEVYAQYLRTKRLRQRTVIGYDTVMRTHLAAYRDKPLRSIDEAAVREIHAKYSKTSPGQADLTMRFLRAQFNFAKFEYRGVNNEILFQNNPVHILSHLKLWNNAPRRQTRLLKTELPAFFQALDTIRAEGDHFAIACCDLVEMAILTGLRRSELLSLQWDAVNRAEGIFYVSLTKNGDPLELPISKRLASIFERRYELRVNENWVFSVANQAGVIREPKKVIQRVVAESGVSFSLHDLRRTFTTIAESLNLGTYTIKRLLNHRAQRNDVTAGYTVLTPEELREPSQKIENKLLALAGLLPNEPISGLKLDTGQLLQSLDDEEQQQLLAALLDNQIGLRVAS